MAKFYLGLRDATLTATTGSGSFVLRNASNTGIAGAGISEGSLTTTAGATYNSSFNGQTITGKKFTDTVTVSGTNITINGCLFEVAAGSFNKGLVNTGTGTTISNCTFRRPTGSVYMQIHHSSGSLTVDLCDISRGENNITCEASNMTVRRSYLHDSSNASNPGGHMDTIEVYGGSNILIELSTLAHPTDDTAAVNIAPWFGSTSVSNVTIQDNYIDGGHMHIVVDLQSSGTITNTRVKRNKMGGHTTPGVIGSYTPLLNSDNRTIVQTEAALTSTPNGILWPTSGADLNTWDYCTSNPFGYANLSPDRSGQTVTP